MVEELDESGRNVLVIPPTDPLVPKITEWSTVPSSWSKGFIEHDNPPGEDGCFVSGQSGEHDNFFQIGCEDELIFSLRILPIETSSDTSFYDVLGPIMTFCAR